MIGAMIASTVLGALGKHFQNTYNSPIRQKQRLMKAGFSPNAMFMGVDAGNMSDAPLQDLDFTQASTLIKNQIKSQTMKAVAEGTKLSSENKYWHNKLPAGTTITYDKDGNPQITSNFSTNYHKRQYKVEESITTGTQKQEVEIQNLGTQDEKLKAEIIKLGQDTSTSGSVETLNKVNSELAKQNIRVAKIIANNQAALTEAEVEKAQELAREISARADNAELQGAALKSILAPYYVKETDSYNLPKWVAIALMIAEKATK